jgi:hypothetical protein
VGFLVVFSLGLVAGRRRPAIKTSSHPGQEFWKNF